MRKTVHRLATWVLAGTCLLLAAGCDLGGTRAVLEHTEGASHTCVDDADCGDGNPCTADVCVSGRCGHTALPDQSPCDDGRFCSEGDHCLAGECIGAARGCSNLSGDCAEGVCSEEQDRCVGLPFQDGTPCNDGQWCTGGDEGDSCLAGQCAPGPAPCDDHDPCTQDTCDEQGDVCQSTLRPQPGLEGLDVGGTCTNEADDDCDRLVDGDDPDCIQCTADIDCNDQNPCTEDTCPGGRCQNLALGDGSTCDDGLFCTHPDTCQGGVCTGPRRCASLDSACAVGTCYEDQQRCEETPQADSSPCEDGLYCTTGDYCLGGDCRAGPDVPCDDGDACTLEECTEEGPQCTSVLVPVTGAEGLGVGATCANGLDDDCDRLIDGADGDCQQCQTALQCDDDDVCTEDDCVANACAHTPGVPGTPCVDGHFCTVNDSCRQVAGNLACTGDPNPCDDQDPCTLDRCDDQSGVCVNTFDPTGLTEQWMGDPVCEDGVDQDCDGASDEAEPACLTCPGPLASFEQGTPFGLVSSAAQPVIGRRFVLADFDRDHITDVAVLQGGAMAVRVYLGQGSDGRGNGLFTPGPELEVPGAVDLAVVDYDRDGKPDLYVAGAEGVGSFLVALRGQGDGSFGPGTLATVALSGVSRLAVADLDLDRIPDAAITLSASNQVVVFLAEGSGGRGAGTFQAGPAFTLAGHGDSIVAAELSGDAYPDLAVGLSSTAQVAILINQGMAPGTVGFDPALPFTACASYDGVADIHAGLLDRDGAVDLVVACQAAGVEPGISSKVHALIAGVDAGGRPDGTFTANGGVTFAGHVAALAVVQVDGAGALDLLGAHHPNSTGGDLSLAFFRGQSNGAFAAPVLHRLGSAMGPLGALQAADLDGDLLPDVMTTQSSTYTSMLVGLAQGRGGLGDCGLAPLPPAGAIDTPEGVALADLDGDAVEDLVAVGGAAALRVFLGVPEDGRGTGTFSYPIDVGVPSGCSEPMGLATGDLDRDGDLDLVMACHGTVVLSGLGILSNDGFGGLTPAAAPATDFAGARAVAVADLDQRDGPDLVVAADGPGVFQVEFHRNQGDGVFGLGVPYATGAALSSSQPAAVAVADLNADGLLDLIVANSGSDSVAVLLGEADAEGRPAGIFSAYTPFAACEEPVTLAVADFNQDGAPDVAVGCRAYSTCALRLLRGALVGGHPTGNLVDATPGDCLGFVYKDAFSLVATELDGDGWPDLVAVGNASRRLHVLRNRASGMSFDSAEVDLMALAGCEGPAWLALGQVNPDGIPDVAVSCHHVSSLLVLAGTGTCAGVP